MVFMEIWLSWSHLGFGEFQLAKVDEGFKQARQEETILLPEQKLHMVQLIKHGVHTEDKPYIK